MSKGKRGRWLAASALIAGAMVPGGGCGVLNAVEDKVCASDLAAKAQAFEGAVDALVTVSTDMRAKLAVACAGIAKDLGETPPEVGDGTKVSDDTMKQACDLASSAIQAKIAATSNVVPVIEGGHCEVDAQAQFDCEAKCDVDGKCSAPMIEARCDPGDLSGECDGSCTANATCEGSATVAATCQGSCEARCTGSCDGNCIGSCDGGASSGPCSGMCVGRCDKTCKGTCAGDCKLDADAMVMCGANVDCRGGCSVAYKAPRCEGELKPPSCDIDAECEAGCSGQGTLSATCTPPTVKILAGGDAALIATLEKNLPAIADVAAQGALVAKAAADVSSAATSVVNEVADSAGCAVIYGVDFATKLKGSVEASLTITVSVQATAGVVGSVGGG